MAGLPEHPQDEKSQLQLDIPNRPRALESISYNSIIASDIGTSSEDELPEPVAEEVKAAIGVSIGQEQTRLTSPKTPAVEKQAAIDEAGGFFGGVDGTSNEDQDEGEVGDDRVQETTRPQQESSEEPSDLIRSPTNLPPRSPARLPSPWRAEARTFNRDPKGRSALLDGVFSYRRRASSGPETWFEGWQKSIKRFSMQSSVFATAREDVESQPTQAIDSAEKVLAARPPLVPVRSRASQLRRTASDESLITQRTLSTVESLGDDTRFEDVQAMVNSRMKAIRDSIADSSIKMPSFSMSTMTPEFLRSSASSLNTGTQASNSSTGTAASAARQPRPVDPMTRQPYTSAKAAVADTTSGLASTHPNFFQAVNQLEGDVVVLGGYRGSILRSAEPPHRQLWVPVKVGLNLRKADLEVGIEEGDDARATSKIIPGGMLSHIGPVDISRRLFKRLRSCKNARSGRLRILDYGYDWRLDPNYLSDQLIEFLESLPCNKPSVCKEERGATVIAHSLGGLITRHAVNRRPELFKGVVYAGVPNTCVNILGPMRNGDEVLLSSRVLTAQVNFTIRTSFALLPLDGRCFFDKRTKEEYAVDFFDPQTWIDHRLSPCVGRPLPPLAVQPRTNGITGYVSSMASALPALPLPGRRNSVRAKEPPKIGTARGAAEPSTQGLEAGDSAKAMLSGNIDNPKSPDEPTTSISTTVTMPRQKAIEYLTRTLASVKKFKQELAVVPSHATSNAYPPVSVIYGKSTPTVYGAKVDGKEGIKHADAYDELAFASGDGVVLAKAAMVPDGYRTAKGGIVASDRGHVTLLGDLEAVGRCLNAIGAARRKGVGLVSDIA